MILAACGGLYEQRKALTIFVILNLMCLNLTLKHFFLSKKILGSPALAFSKTKVSKWLIFASQTFKLVQLPSYERYVTYQSACLEFDVKFAYRSVY